MAFETVTIDAAGLSLLPVTVSVRISAEEAARSFEAKIKHPTLSQAEMIRRLKSAPCTIKAGPTLVLTGHIEKLAVRLAGDEKEIVISGRSKTGDAIDSSAMHKTGEFVKKTAPQVFAELAGPHKIKIETAISHVPVEVFRLRPGETVFKAMERWARKEGFSIGDTAAGNFRLIKDPKERHEGAISDGDNIPSLRDASAVFDDSKRAARTQVKAQAPDGYKPEKLQIEQEAEDSPVRQNRVRVIVPPESLSKDEARSRARWHRDRAAGAGTTAEVSVVGWRDRAGQIWEPGRLIFVDIADLGLSQTMMVESVDLRQADAGSGGTSASLSLVDPRAYGGKAGKGAKSGEQWNLGKSGGDDE